MIAIITFIYPNSVHYFPEFIRNIKQQTDQSFKLIIFNDGVDTNLEEFMPVNHEIYSVSGSPLEIRFKALELLKNLPFDKYIFTDIDDLMSENRTEVMNSLLENYPIVCNDINIMQEDGQITQYKIWEERLGCSFEFDYTFIQNKNIVGLGNTGMTKKMLSGNLLFSPLPLVADWFIFYQLLKNTKETCLFTAKCQTHYRQHPDNQIGLKKITDQRIQYVIKVVEHHYHALKEIGCDHLEIKTINNNNNSPLFWWEEII